MRLNPTAARKKDPETAVSAISGVKFTRGIKRVAIKVAMPPRVAAERASAHPIIHRVAMQIPGAIKNRKIKAGVKINFLSNIVEEDITERGARHGQNFSI